MDREIKSGQIYRHFKGFKAEIIAIATHTETEEKLVIYHCTSPDTVVESNHKPGIYARPLTMFLSEVDHDKYPNVSQKYRFELIEENNKGS